MLSESMSTTRTDVTDASTLPATPVGPDRRRRKQLHVSTESSIKHPLEAHDLLTSPVTLPTPTHQMFSPAERRGQQNKGKKSLTPTAGVARDQGKMTKSPWSGSQESIGNSDSPTFHSRHAPIRATHLGLTPPQPRATSPVLAHALAATQPQVLADAAQLAIAQQQLMLLSSQAAQAAVQGTVLPTALRPRQQQAESAKVVEASTSPVPEPQPSAEPPAEPRTISSAERTLVNQVEGCLLDKSSNPHMGSVAVVVVQRTVMSKAAEEYEEVIKGHYGGSFHSFLRSHAHLCVFHYDQQSIREWGLQHCSTHEGRLTYADVPPEEVRRKDQKTSAWKQGEFARVRDALEEIVRREPMPMRQLLIRFHEYAERQGANLGQIPSNHALRQILKRNPTRFAITPEAIVKLPEQLNGLERSEWEQKLHGHKGGQRGKAQSQQQKHQHQQQQQQPQQQQKQQRYRPPVARHHQQHHNPTHHQQHHHQHHHPQQQQHFQQHQHQHPQQQPQQHQLQHQHQHFQHPRNPFPPQPQQQYPPYQQAGYAQRPVQQQQQWGGGGWSYSCEGG
eukprot:Hpha_TRINITY_DN15763_c5_g2::TRINITY_DN15763_c5_g2_i5::g.37023::m.37023